MKKLKFKIQAICRLLTSSHGIVVSLDREDLCNLFQGKSFNVKTTHFGVGNYAFFLIMKAVAESRDDIDMVLEKVKLEAKIEELNNIEE